MDAPKFMKITIFLRKSEAEWELTNQHIPIGSYFQGRS